MTDTDPLDEAVVVRTTPTRTPITPDALIDGAMAHAIIENFVPLPASGIDGARMKLACYVPQHIGDAIDGTIHMDGLPKGLFKDRSTFMRFSLVVGLSLIREWADQHKDWPFEEINDEELRALVVAEQQRGRGEIRARVGFDLIQQAQTVMREAEPLIRMGEYHRAAYQIEGVGDEARRLTGTEYARLMIGGLIQTDQNKADLRTLVELGYLHDPLILDTMVRRGVITTIPEHEEDGDEHEV